MPQDGMADPVGERSDMEELKEVVIEFLSKYEALYEKRIQKLVFYGEIYAIENYGERLTDADFMPYLFGPYSRRLHNVVEELTEDSRIGETREGQLFCQNDVEGGELSPEKKDLINQVHSETCRMTTDELVDFAKDTWFWQAFEEEEEIDFLVYAEELALTEDERDRLNRSEDRNPVETQDTGIFH